MRGHENQTISRGTVYRNLNLLVDNNEIARLRMSIGANHFDFEI
ncbi:MAG: transcriptional repressor [Clostridia bacterium]